MTRPILVAGGGTGGHVFVAEAVAEALVAAGIARRDLQFVGSKRGQDAELLKDTGIELVALPGRGIKRSLAPRAIVDNAQALIEMASAFVSSLALVARLRPRCVVSVGGYAAAPVGLAAVMWRRPLVLVNVDAVPGVTNRLLNRFAAASCVAFEGTPMERAVVTGAPVRSEFGDLDRSAPARRKAKRALGVDPDRPLVAVVTGSLGARSVNLAVCELAAKWAEQPVTLYHVTGRRDFEMIERTKHRAAGDLLDYQTVAFEDRVPLLFQAADVAVTRAGALTVAELALLGLPSLLVPLPGAPGDHQTLNAQALATAGGGEVIADGDVSAQILMDRLGPLLERPDRLMAMGEQAARIGHRNAAGSVAEVVIAHAR